MPGNGNTGVSMSQALVKGLTIWRWVQKTQQALEFRALGDMTG